MSRYLVYRSGGKLGTDELETAGYVFFDEDDVKVGRVRPGHDPLLGKEPEDIVTADSLKEAKARFAERRANMFQ